jgi:hypothetical protein
MLNRQSNIELLKTIIAFVFGILVPVILFYGYKYFNTEQLEEQAKSDKIFPSSLNVRSVYDNFSIKSDPLLLPSGDKDFMIALWYRLLKQPAIGEKSFLIQKYEKNSKKHEGYAVALQRDSEGIRPLVYWMDTEGHGRWHYFEAIDYNSKEWQVLVISFIKGKLLGAHSLTLYPNSENIKLLGGYSFNQDTYALSSSDLILGGVKQGSLPRVKIGAFATIHKVNLAESLEDYLKKIAVLRPVKDTIKELAVDQVFIIDNFTE